MGRQLVSEPPRHLVALEPDQGPGSAAIVDGIQQYRGVRSLEQREEPHAPGAPVDDLDLARQSREWDGRRASRLLRRGRRRVTTRVVGIGSTPGTNHNSAR